MLCVLIRCDSNEFTQYTIFNIEKKIAQNYSKPAAMGFFPRDSRTSLKRPSRVNELSVFEPLKVYCNYFSKRGSAINFA